jgi:hypothetical protein
MPTRYAADLPESCQDANFQIDPSSPPIKRWVEVSLGRILSTFLPDRPTQLQRGERPLPHSLFDRLIGKALSPNYLLWQDSRMTPFDPSDLQVGDRSLPEAYHGENFPDFLYKALLQLREGLGCIRLRGVPRTIAGIDGVYLTGGNSAAKSLRARFSGFAVPILFAEDGVFGGERGGLAMLETLNRRGFVIDIGETQLKISGGGGRQAYKRDLRFLPKASEVPRRQYPEQRQRLRDFVSTSVTHFMAQMQERPDAVVIALPTGFTNMGIPGGSSYAGMEGDVTLIPDVLRQVGLTNIPVILVMGVELAGISALLDSRTKKFRRLLLVSLGTDLATALVLRP